MITKTLNRCAGLILFNKKNEILLYRNKRSIYCPSYEIVKELPIVTAINGLYNDTYITTSAIYEIKNHKNLEWTIFEGFYNVDQLEDRYDELFPNFFKRVNKGPESFKFCSIDELDSYNKESSDLVINEIWKSFLRELLIIR
jgi:hypothetical protein